MSRSVDRRIEGEGGAASPAAPAGDEPRACDRAGDGRPVRRGRPAGGLTPTQERVLGYIAMRCAGSGAAAVSKAELAARMDCCMKTVDRAVGRLKAEGYIEVAPAFDEAGGQVANEYRLKGRAE